MRRLIMIAAAAGLALTACGDDDDGDTADATTAVAETAAATDTTEAATDTTGAGSLDADGEAAALAWTTAFDSATSFDAKAPFIVDAEALRPTIEAYGPAGQAVGGITVVPTDVAIAGDVATITYDVLFAGQSPGYPPQTGTVQRIDGEWKVSREEFCAFMASARNTCPA